MNRNISAKNHLLSGQDRLASPGSLSTFCFFAQASKNSFNGGVGLSGEASCFFLSRLKP